LIVSGSSCEALAAEAARLLGGAPLRRRLRRFPDGEIELRLDESVRGGDVYVVQSTCPPVDATTSELLFLVDACRLAGAARVTAVVPYLGYARQDRRVHGREPLGARLVARMLAAAGVDRLVAVDLHSAAIESAFTFPVEHLSAVPALAAALRPLVGRRAVVVSPDLGAVKLAERYARALDLPVAVVHKERVSGSEVRAERVIGDVTDREPVIVDDMIVTGATIEAAIGAVRAAGARTRTVVAATHLVLVPPALDRLAALSECELLGSDSVPVPPRCGIPTTLVGLGELLSQAVYSLYCDRTITELASHA
jgi:ribose-phosphate pyrophosphokinase